MKLSLGFLRNIQTSSYPRSFQALSQQIRLYFISKLLISIIIVLERLFVQLRDDNSDTTAYFLLIIADFLCSLILEWLLFGLMTRWKIVDIVQEVVICILHVVTYEFLIECSLAMFIPTDEQIQVLKHDILFLTTLAFIFIESTIFRTLTFIYIIAIFFHRLSPVSEAVYYASWAVMTAIVLLVSLRFTQQKWICEKGSIPDKLKNDFETYLHGLALVTTQGNILYMNGNFKGILNSTDDLEALEDVLRLRKFESYPERARRGFMDEIRNEKAATPHMLTLKSKMSVRTKDFARQQSIGTRFKKSMDAEKASGVTFKPSVDVKEEPKRESYDRSSYNLFPNNENGQTAATVTGKKARAPAYLLPKSANEKNETEQEFIHEENVKAAIEALFTDLQNNTRLKATWEWHEPGKRWLNALNAVEGSPKKNPQEAAYVQRATMTPTMVQKIKVIYRTPINSELKLLEVKLYPFKNSQEEGVFMSLNDITLETRAQDAMDLSEQKDRLLRFVSHEFRQPLSSCLSLLEMLKGNISYNLVTSFLEPAINSNKILLSQVNDLLDFAQIKAKRLRIAVQPCNLKRVIEEVFGMMKLGATTRDIALKLDWDSSILRNFCTDPLRVKQILLNLISNAYKFTPPEGSVTVKLTNADNSMGRVVRVEVIDTGTGMTEEQQKGLFGEFKQVMQTFHINPRGVGLGLIISKLLSQQLGTGTSDLRVESEKGKGTTFSFLLLSKPEEVTKQGFITEELDVSDDISRDKPDKLLQKMEDYGKVVNATQPTLRGLSPKLNVTEASPKGEMTKLKAFELKMNMQRLENNRRAGLGSMKSNTVFSNTSIIVDPIRLSAYSQGSHGPNGPLGHSITQVKGPRRQAGRSQKKRAQTIGRSHTSIGGGEGGNEVDLMSFEFANLVENLNFRCSCQKVLLVDDDAFNLTAVSILLKSMGLETTKAVDGERAIQEVIKNEGHNPECKNFSIIFMDVEMPAFNGFETTKVLRRKMLEGEISFIPIIGVTGHNPKEKRVECLISGMNDIVMKPLAPQIVQSLVLKWVTEVDFE